MPSETFLGFTQEEKFCKLLTMTDQTFCRSFESQLQFIVIYKNHIFFLYQATFIDHNSTDQNTAVPK